MHLPIYLLTQLPPLVTTHSERHRGYGSRSMVPGSFLRTLATTLRHGILKTRGTFIPRFLVPDSVLIGQLGFCVFVWANGRACYSCGNVTLQCSELSMVTTQVQTLTGSAECPVTKWRLFSKCESVVWVTKSKSTRSTLWFIVKLERWVHLPSLYPVKQSSWA